MATPLLVNENGTEAIPLGEMKKKEPKKKEPKKKEPKKKEPKKKSTKTTRPPTGGNG